MRFNSIDAPRGWAWDEVRSDDRGNAVVNWTLPAEANTLDIAKREDGVWLDAIRVANDVILDQATLLDAISQVAVGP